MKRLPLGCKVRGVQWPKKPDRTRSDTRSDHPLRIESIRRHVGASKATPYAARLRRKSLSRIGDLVISRVASLRGSLLKVG
jgi:hypothetical protein